MANTLSKKRGKKNEREIKKERKRVIVRRVTNSFATRLTHLYTDEPADTLTNRRGQWKQFPT